MDDAKRAELRERIEAGRARQEERERALGGGSAVDRITAAAREHPLLLIGGGLAIGAVLSTLIPKSPTRKLSKNAIAMIAAVAELGIAYGKQAIDAADEASKPALGKIGQIGKAIAHARAKPGAELETDEVEA